MLRAFMVILNSAYCIASLNISAREGLPVSLPCTFLNPSVPTPYVRWRTGSEVVFERRRTEAYEGPGYGGRVDVPEDELRKGNCSLVLKNVRKADEGIYKSYLLRLRVKRDISTPDWSLVQSVELSVDVPEETPKPPAKDRATVSGPHPLLVAVSFLCCLLFTKKM